MSAVMLSDHVLLLSFTYRALYTLSQCMNSSQSLVLAASSSYLFPFVRLSTLTHYLSPHAPILRNQTPALKDGSRMLIMEPLHLEDVEVPENEEYRNSDLETVKICRAIERMVERTKALFEEASKETPTKLPWVLKLPKSAIVELVPPVDDGKPPKGRFHWSGIYGLKDSLNRFGEGIWDAQ